MKRSTKYVALDVHKATTVASVREDSGRVIARTVLPTEAAAGADNVSGRSGRPRAMGSPGWVVPKPHPADQLVKLFMGQATSE